MRADFFNKERGMNMKKIAFTLFVLAGVLSGRAEEAPAWVYDPEEGVISNAVWKLKVTTDGLDAGCLRLGIKDGAHPGANGGHAFTETGGGMLDLSGEIRDEGGSLWRMTALGNYSLYPTGGGDTRISKLVFPTTLTDVGVNVLMDNNDSYSRAIEEVIMDIPEFTGALPDHYFRYLTDCQSVRIHAPKMKTLGATLFRYVSNTKIDFSTWNVEAVETVKNLAWMGATSTGFLKLPLVLKFDGSQHLWGSGVEELDLGSRILPSDNQTLTLGSQAIRACKKLTNILVGAYAKVEAGADTFWNMAVDGSAQCSLKNIRFLGKPFEGAQTFLDAALLRTSVPADGTKQLTIRASRRLGWTTDLAFIDSPKGEEITVAENLELAEGEELIGVYVTAAGGRKAWVIHQASPHEYASLPTIRLYDPRFDVEGVEEVTVSCNKPMVDGKFEFGSTVTLTAACNEKTTFAEWRGLPDMTWAKSNTVSIVVDENFSGLDIVLRAAPKWIYASDEQVIYNDVWRLNVTTDGLGAGCLRIKDGAHPGAAGGHAFTEQGDGILDLSGEIRDGDNAPFEITEVGAYSFYPRRQNDPRLTKFVFPETVTSLGSGALSDNDLSYTYSMDEIIMDIPAFEGTLPDHFFRSFEFLGALVIRAPKMTKMGKTIIAKIIKGEIDTSAWNLENVQELGNYCLEGGILGTQNAYKGKIKGPLKLCSVTKLSDQALRRSDVTDVDLGSKLLPRHGATLTIGTQAFYECKKLESILFGAYANMTATGSADFSALDALKSLTFLGRPFENAQVFIDNVLASKSAPADGTKPVTIRASRSLAWDRCAFVSPVNRDDANEVAASEALKATLAKGESLIGVYVTAAGERKAWVVHTASPYDPKGTVIVFR